MSDDPLDVELEDDELLSEVTLTASLMIAANESAGRLSADQIDQILGIA